MAAVARIDAFHGPQGVGSVFPDGGRLHRADTDPTTDDGTVAILIPDTGVGYSLRKSLKLNFTQTPVGSISNLRFFGDGVSWGTGVTCYIKAVTTYVEAAESDERILFDPAAVDVIGYTSVAPLVVQAGTVLSNPATGYGNQNYLVLQLAGTYLALGGAITPRTVTYRWDET